MPTTTRTKEPIPTNLETAVSEENGMGKGLATLGGLLGDHADDIAKGAVAVLDLEKEEKKEETEPGEPEQPDEGAGEPGAQPGEAGSP